MAASLVEIFVKNVAPKLPMIDWLYPRIVGDDYKGNIYILPCITIGKFDGFLIVGFSWLKSYIGIAWRVYEKR
jgi:hypothetical protein